MPGVEAHAQLTDGLAGIADFRQLAEYRWRLGIPTLSVKGVGVGAGVNFANTGANAGGGLDLRDFCIDEDAGGDAGVGETADDITQACFLPDNVQSTFGGHLMPPFGDQHGHFRLDAAGEGDHLLGGGHFEIELDLRALLQPADVSILNMPAILAQMHGNPVGAPQMGFNSRPQRIRFISAPCLADGGDVVDIDPEFDHHNSCNSLNIFRVSSSLPAR